MSTRRARIKAIASLPVRRKNQDSKDTSKNKPSTPKQLVENLPAATTEDNKLTENLSEVEKLPADTHNEAKPNQTPKRIRTSSVHTPNLIERARTPRSKERVISPHSKLSPPVKTITPPLAQKQNEKIHGKPTPVIKQTDTSTVSIQSSDAVPPHSIPVTRKDTNTVDGISSIQDYNPPSIPESVTEETVLDGIVPLHSNRSAPKPLDLLKNEIISENAEVLFDPIVPLPSPSKVRPKLRPAPRLAFRRNSIQVFFFFSYFSSPHARIVFQRI